MPWSVPISISSSGADGMVPTAVRIGRASGALTARTLTSRMVRTASPIARLLLDDRSTDNEAHARCTLESGRGDTAEQSQESSPSPAKVGKGWVRVARGGTLPAAAEWLILPAAGGEKTAPWTV